MAFFAIGIKAINVIILVIFILQNVIIYIPEATALPVQLSLDNDGGNVNSTDSNEFATFNNNTPYLEDVPEPGISSAYTTSNDFNRLSANTNKYNNPNQDTRMGEEYETETIDGTEEIETDLRNHPDLTSTDELISHSDSEGVTDSSWILTNYKDAQKIEYKIGLILRCAAIGQDDRPIVSWKYYGKPLPDYLTVFSRDSFSASEQDSIINNLLSNDQQKVDMNKGNSTYNPEETNDLRKPINKEFSTITGIKKDFINWVDFKLPKLNMALYGPLSCVSKTKDGQRSKRTFFLIRNGNSSISMKLLRTSLAALALFASVFVYRYCLWYGEQRKRHRYKKLPLDDYKIVQRFKKGLNALSSQNSNEDEIGPAKLSHCNKSYISTMTVETTLSLELTSSISSNSSANIGINSWLDCIAYDEKKEVLKENFKIDFDQQIQEHSQFGYFYMGKIRSPKTMKYEQVVVKTLASRRGDSNFCSQSLLEELLKELKILASLPRDNFCIVNLKAAFTQRLYKLEVLIFLEHCKYGSLAGYIDCNKVKFRNDFSPILMIDKLDKASKRRSELSQISLMNDENENLEKNNPSNVDESKKCVFTTEDLVVWSAEIAEGMRFLHKNKIVHGNLSTSNVFLTEEFIAKVGNIGYAPKATSISVYPPECRCQTEYTPKSDVWAFGMTLYEIFSLRSPKLTHPNEQKIIDHFAIGSPLKYPKYSNLGIQNLIESCWNPEPNFRPEFTQISENLKQLLQDEFN